MDNLRPSQTAKLVNMPAKLFYLEGRLVEILEGAKMRLVMDIYGKYHHAMSCLVNAPFITDEPLAVHVDQLEFVRTNYAVNPKHDQDKGSWDTCQWRPNEVTLKAMAHQPLIKYFKP